MERSLNPIDASPPPALPSYKGIEVIMRRGSVKGYLLSGSLILAAAAIPVAAQDPCAQILKYNIFDVSTKSTEDDLSLSLIKALSQKELRNDQEAKNFFAHAGITVPDLPTPVQLGIGAGSSTDSSYAKSLNEYFRQDLDARKRFHQQFVTANPAIVAAWRDCATKRKGLIAWIQPGDDPDNVALLLELRPVSADLPSSATIQSVTGGNGVIDRESLAVLINKKVGPNPIPFVLHRVSRQGTTIAIHTNSADYNASVEIGSVVAVGPALFYYTDFNSFTAASVGVRLLDDFEAVDSTDFAMSAFTSKGVTYIGYGGTPAPNVWVASKGYSNFGAAPTSSQVLTANGDEDFFMKFDRPPTAIGFNTYCNSYGPVTIEVHSAAGLLGTYQLTQDPRAVGFFGVVSREPISLIRWKSINGGIVNTGIDNLYVGEAKQQPKS